MKSGRPILVATDFSDGSRRALDEAAILAKALRCDLLIAHVLINPRPEILDAAIFPQVYTRIEAEIRADATRRLKTFVKRADKSGVPVSSILLRGTPHQQILDLARKRKARMIVAGTHGRTGFSRLVIGSIASRLIAGATCPVLTVRDH